MRVKFLAAAFAAIVMGAPGIASAAPAAPMTSGVEAEGMIHKVVGPIWYDGAGRQCERGSSGVVSCRRVRGGYGGGYGGGGGWGDDGGYYRPRRQQYGGGPKFWVDRYGRQCERASSGHVSCQ